MIWNRNLRVYKLRESSDLFSCGIYSYRTYLDDLTELKTKTCCLYIEYNIFTVQTLSMSVIHKTFSVIYKIAFHTVNDCKIIRYSLYVISNREGLCNTVVSYGHSFMSPGHSTLKCSTYISYGIKITVACMKMEFYSLLLCIVCSGNSEIRYSLNTIYRLDHNFLGPGIKSKLSLNLYKITNADFLNYISLIICIYKHFKLYGISKVSEAGCNNNLLTISDLLLFNIKDKTSYNYLTGKVIT